MIATIIIFATILYFVVAGVFKSQPGQSSKQFFFMGHSASMGNYVDTTVAYSLQVAVTIYFVFWGYRYGWSNIFFVITWCLGILLFSLAAPLLARVLDRHETMLSFLASDSLTLRRIAASLIVLSLFGLMYTELFFCTQFLATSVSFYSPGVSFTGWFWLTFLVLLLAISLYVSIGGVQKVVATDKQQLLLAYGASTLFFIAIQDDVAKSGARIFYWTYIPVFMAYLGLALGCAITAMISAPAGGRRFRLFPREFSPASTYAPFTCAVILGAFMLVPPEFGAETRTDFPKSVSSMVTGADAHGIWALIGFGVANLIWQFSDYTAYHRLALLNLGATEQDRTLQVRRSILATMLSSPLTWSLGIFAGMAIDATGLVRTADYGQTVFNLFTVALINGAQAGDTSQYVALVALGVFLVAVMLSTVDSAFISAGKLLMLDFAPDRSFTTRFRLACVLLCTLTLMMFAVLHAHFQINIFLGLGVFYSWGLIFGPIMICKLYSTAYSTRIATLAMLAGAIAAAAGSINPLSLPVLSATVFSQLLALSVTSLLMVMGLALNRRMP